MRRIFGRRRRPQVAATLHAIADRAGTVLKLAAGVGLGWMVLRSIPEGVRYVKMLRM